MDYTIHIKPFGELSAIQLHHITQAREAVFFLEQQINCADADAVDPQSTFLWLEIDSEVIAFLRMIPSGVVYAEASIGRVLVRKEYRRKGLCRQIMIHALNYIASEWGKQPIRISSQSYIARLYCSLGFVVDSEEYLEAGIAHVKMVIRGDK